MRSEAATAAHASLTTLETVRSATLSRHRHLESLPVNVRLMQVDYCIAEYRSILDKMYGIYEPLYLRSGTAGSHLASLLATCVERLRLDLIDLGCTSAEFAALKRCEQLPALDRPDLELGCAYVYAGAALGGRIVVEHLKGVFQNVADVPFRFYSGDGDDTVARWRAFCVQLNAEAIAVDDVCMAAVVAFDAMIAWLADDNAYRAPAMDGPG